MYKFKAWTGAGMVSADGLKVKLPPPLTDAFVEDSIKQVRLPQQNMRLFSLYVVRAEVIPDGSLFTAAWVNDRTLPWPRTTAMCACQPARELTAVRMS